MRIGDITLEHGIFLAPMAGVSDLPFRLLCREQGCEMAVTEMVSAKAIWYNRPLRTALEQMSEDGPFPFGDRGTTELLRTVPEDRPLSLQLFGSDPEICGEIAALLEKGPWDCIDFNMGCPVPKVVNNYEGSRLMTDPELAGQVIRAMTKRVRKPVTVKIRAGFDKAHVNAPEFAKVLEDAGAAAIAVHGRTRDQYYSGTADREVIRRVKEAVSVPVIGNGDIRTAQDAVSMMEETGCDGIMVGRGAEGNPWLFREIRSFLAGGTVPERPSAEEKKEMMLRHLSMQIAQDGEHMGILRMRSHFAWYLHGIPNAAAVRNRVNTASGREELEVILTDALKC